MEYFLEMPVDFKIPPFLYHTSVISSVCGRMVTSISSLMSFPTPLIILRNSPIYSVY